MQSLFQTNGIAWKLLRDTPDRYIYEAARKGVDIPLPEDIEAGINDVSKRDGWNKPAATEYALPTETWREHIARRRRCLELRQKLIAGKISSINDIVTYNLNIRQLAQDVIENCYDPELVWAFYQAITKITILDPTCGSGAFLFAALNILEPLYDACLEQMQIYLDERFKPANENAAQILDKFSEILQQINHHPNRRYFILKTIIINNLYGVDIMQEATEICKLRLYLKLASQVDIDKSKPNNGIEPLPDIDFNIRAGNTLVGFSSLDEVKEAIKKESSGQMKLVYDNSVINQIEQKAQHVDKVFQEFRSLQVVANMDTNTLYNIKSQLRVSLGELREELDKYLAEEYERELSKNQVAFQKFKDTHESFHWFIEFYGILKRGGFDVIIGNPPYVEYSKVRKEYKIINFDTEECGNIYAFIIERSIKNLHNNSYLGLIIPISSFSTQRALPLQNFWKLNISNGWLSHFGVRPAKLFNGVDQRVTIAIGQKVNNNLSSVYSTQYLRWYSEERESLFQLIKYEIINTVSYQKTGLEIINDILIKLKGQTLAYNFDPNGNYTLYWHRIPQYFIKAIDFEPYFYSDRDGIKRSEDYKIFKTTDEIKQKCIMALLNSSLAYFYWMICSEGYHFGRHEVLDFPANINNISNINKKILAEAATNLMSDYQQNLVRKNRNQRNTCVEYDEFRPKLSKMIMDKIDNILAKHFGFTDEELDFIINYDIKYRMGRDSENENDIG